MLLLLFGTLWGGLLALLLCAPYSYYPLFFIILAASIVIYFVSKKYFKLSKKLIYPIAAVLFLLSYSLCTYIIFKPADFHYVSNENLVKDKKAVIFYCEGEMEKYTPYYASYFFKDAPLILKPVYAMGIKRIYRQIEVNTKNKELINVAQEVKNSLLNYKPYYFYICFEGYVPDIKDSIHSAISDGCSEIIVLNYTANYDLEKNISRKIDIENLKTKGIDIRFTQSVCNTDMFVELFTSKIVNMPFKWDGIIILGNDDFASSKIKASLEQVGYEDSQIIISRNIPESINYFSNRDAKSILYVNLSETSSGIKSDLVIPAEFERYRSDIKITGIKSWGYDKRLVKASIKIFLEAENPSR